MREWRKVHRSITSSDRLANVSDSAWRLYVLFLVNQDDRGAYPWTKPLIRTLIAGTSWTEEQAAAYAEELRSCGLVEPDGDMLIIRRGSELNGPPTNGPPGYRIPRLYTSPTEPVRTENVHRTNPVLTESVLGLRLRLRRDLTPCSPPKQGDAAAAKKRSLKTPFTPPSWFEPLTTLEGYVRRDHAKAIKVLALACETAHIEPADLARAFAAFWPEGQAAYGWRDPVSAFVKTREVQISKLRAGGRDGTGASATRPTSVDASLGKYG